MITWLITWYVDTTSFWKRTAEQLTSRTPPVRPYKNLSRPPIGQPLDCAITGCKHTVRSPFSERLSAVNWSISPWRNSLPLHSHHNSGAQSLLRINSSNQQQQSTAAINSSNQQRQPAAASNRSNQQQQSTAGSNSSNQQQQSTEATNSSNQQQEATVAINSSNQQRQPAAAINSGNQQQQPTAAINSSNQQQQSTAAINSSNQQQQRAEASSSNNQLSSYQQHLHDQRWPLLVITTVPSSRDPASSRPRTSCPVAESHHRTEALFVTFSIF